MRSLRFYLMGTSIQAISEENDANRTGRKQKLGVYRDGIEATLSSSYTKTDAVRDPY